MNKNVVLAIGAVLIFVGVFKPDLSNIIPKGGPNNMPQKIEVAMPSNPELKDLALNVAEIFHDAGKEGKEDALTLAGLYNDIAILVSMDKENEVIKTTSELREVNSVAGNLMNLKLQGRYAGLPQAARELIFTALGGDSVTVLNEETRTKAVEAFNALAWGCLEGAK